MTTATSYTADWLQTTRPQPMYDKKINYLWGQLFQNNPVHDHNLSEKFKIKFLEWIKQIELSYYTGFETFKYHDIIIGCTQYIDDLYMRLGPNLMTLHGDYKYHQRLNKDIIFYNLETLDKNKELLISMPFPSLGDVHPDMKTILDKCYSLSIPVHIDGAWITCSRNITFDFSHPAIQTLGISLSKGLGLGNNRIGIRFSKIRPEGAITIMNDFNMNCISLLSTGLYFMENLEVEYFWKKYNNAYSKVCNDFNLEPTNAIHLAKLNGQPVGIRPLLRFLADE